MTSNDFSPIDPTESEGSMFAPVPAWERGKKRRGFGGRATRVAPETRSFGAESFSATPEPVTTRPMTMSEDARAYEARMDAVDPLDDSFAATPAYATRVARRNNGAAPIAIAAGIILLGGLAAAGWYAYQPHDGGVAELTPGSPTTTTTTEVASTAPAAGDPKVLAQADTQAPAPTAPPARAVTTTTKTRTPAGSATHTTVTRARPAAESSADASAIAPAPPQAAPTPAPLHLQLPPAAAPPASTAPAAPQALTPVTPQTATPAPAEVPATPPTSQAAPPPTQTPPN